MISTLVAVNRSSVMADQTVTHSSEAQIRSVIDSLAKAIRTKDAAGVARHWAPDLVQFDLAPPLQTVGNDPQGLKDWFASWRGQIGFAITELRVTASEDVAFCHALVHLTGSRTDGSESDVWFRDTLGLRKTLTDSGHANLSLRAAASRCDISTRLKPSLSLPPVVPTIRLAN
jgi:ketosteroid isomerase-like protein